MIASFPPNLPRSSIPDAARHINEEARLVLTSLRGGTYIDREFLASSLRELRAFVRGRFLDSTDTVVTVGEGVDVTTSAVQMIRVTTPPPTNHAALNDYDVNNAVEPASPLRISHTSMTPASSPTPHSVPPPALTTVADMDDGIHHNMQSPQQLSLDPGPYAAPFLAVIVDPRAAGPHTLVALRALYRLMERGSIVQITRFDSIEEGLTTIAQQHIAYETSLESIARGVLACRFEQTDAGADEAVEMAIADLLQLLVELDAAGVLSTEAAMLKRLPSSVILEAFHVVFLTRHTFVRDGGGHHSPALSFHFEQVLMRIIYIVFGGNDAKTTMKNCKMSSRHLNGARKILKFLIDSLSSLDKSSNILMVDDSVGDDGISLCLRLIQCCLRTGWSGTNATLSIEVKDPSSHSMHQSTVTSVEDDVLIRLISDDLCLALLRLGQAPLAQHDLLCSSSVSSSIGSESLNGVRSTISLELLSQVCATFSLLWSISKLRPYLTLQFESIFSGFYQRALSLLRRRPLPIDGIEYQANIIFDVEVEIILENLFDILCMNSGSAAGNSMSTIDELFGTYDCSMTQSDVASGLLAELCQCCGGLVDAEGEPFLPSMSGRSVAPGSNSPESKNTSPMLIAQYRSVPHHLKGLCFEALIGSVRCVFHSVESTVGETESNTKSILRKTKDKKRCLQHAAWLFNEKPKMGLKYMEEKGLIPNPPTPQSVADFLRNSLVVGLNKTAVGQYLGEIGKSAKDTNKYTPVWEQDWFHKELLTVFCSSFGFENQSLLNGLRMFLSAFRLPGEAQMIDRILQAFAESIASNRSSDTAYLLSFSIIILNTDLHNENIKADRRMKLADFIRNNKNYGKEISDGDLPEEYLEDIYRSIKDGQIRTLGEGADGSMTVERWKDVMRSAASFKSLEETIRSGSDVKDQKDLLLESMWLPILSAVSGLWDVARMSLYNSDVSSKLDQNAIVSGARFGIELAYEICSGASKLKRSDVFQDIFTNLCFMTGLFGEYSRNVEERAYNFMDSLERQSALIVAINIAVEYGNLIGLDGWKCVWTILFELRDHKLLSGNKDRSILNESDPDMISSRARLDFCQRMENLDGFIEVDDKPRMSLMNFVFGSAGSLDRGRTTLVQGGNTQFTDRKEDDLIWDELASSDGEDETSPEYLSFPTDSQSKSSIGSQFECQLMLENKLENELIGVTGLERIDSTTNLMSTRQRVRRRLTKLVDFEGLIVESRYLSEEGLSYQLNSLVEIICNSSKMAHGTEYNGALAGLPLSPASEAFAEILLCEITLKNRDRFVLIWNTILRAHYNSRLTYRHSMGREEHVDEEHQSETLKLTPGIEKCVTGILRLCARTTNRNMISSEVLSTLKILHPPLGLLWSPLELNLDKHLAEGLWRIAQNVGLLNQIKGEGWSGILGLVEWCATRGAIFANDQSNTGSLAEDDPSLQAFRSLHLILHAVELKDALGFDSWPQIIRSIRSLMQAGERGRCPKLSIAGLDLLQVLNSRMDPIQAKDDRSQHLLICWRPVLEAISDPAENSRNSGVRQLAISLLTDTLLDKNSRCIPVEGGLCNILSNICIPLAGKRITDLLRIPRELDNDLEETLIEVELCISLLFKPFLHHLKALIVVKQEFVGMWISLLGIMTQLLGDEIASDQKYEIASDQNFGKGHVVTRASLFSTTKELASEHLRNAVMVLVAMGVLIVDEDSKCESQEISSVTWAAIGSIGYCKPFLEEWKISACK